MTDIGSSSLSSSSSSSSSSSVVIGQLIKTGIALGIVHVLTGPDHLSALATLSANVGRCRAFGLGVRWGLGHSTGLIVVAIGMIAYSGESDTVDISETVSSILESFVGVFMLLLGTYGLVRSMQRRKRRRKMERRFVEPRTHVAAGTEAVQDRYNLPLFPSVDGGYYYDDDDDDDDNNDNGDDDDDDDDDSYRDESDTDVTGKATKQVGYGCGGGGGGGRHSEPMKHIRGGVVSLTVTDAPRLSPPLRGLGGGRSADLYKASRREGVEGKGEEEVMVVAAVVEEDTLPSVFGTDSTGERRGIALHHILCPTTCVRHVQTALSHSSHTNRHSTNKVLSFAIGIVHGVAGPGGVLGVVPAVRLRDWHLAALYLATFCCTSIVVMGTFATVYGAISGRVARAANWEFQMEVFSASLSIIVGLMWLTLLSVGKLHDVFP